MEQKLTLITIRKSAIAFQNLSSNLTCDATWRRNRRYVTSGFTNKITDIAYNSETVRDRAKVDITKNRTSAIAFWNLQCHLTCDAIKRTNLRYVTSGFIKNHYIAYNLETVRDRAKVNINHK